MSSLPNLGEQVARTDNWIRFSASYLVGAVLGTAVTVVVYLAFYASAPARDFMAPVWSPAAPRNYKLYTGPEGGAFRQAGEAVAGTRAGDSLQIDAVPTNGSMDNIAFVSTTRQSFGLVGEPFIQDSVLQSLGSKPRRVGPVSMQYIYIAVREDDFRKFQQSCVDKGPLSIPTKRAKNSCSAQFLAARVWDAGPLGSGTRTMANNILEAAQLDPARIATSNDFVTQANALIEGRVGVAFCFSGSESELLVRKKGGAKILIAGVDPRLAAQLRLFELRTTKLESNGTTIETVGAYSTLYATSDVPAEDVAALVGRFANQSKALPILSGIRSAFEAESQERELHWRSALAQFGLTWLTLACAGGTLCAMWLSRRDRARLMQGHSLLLEKALELRGRFHRGVSMIEELYHLASHLDESLRTIHHDALTGRLSLTHREQLLASAAAVRDELRSLLRFHLSNESGREFGPEYPPLFEELVKRGYISLEEWEAFRTREPVSPRFFSDKVPRDSQASKRSRSDIEELRQSEEDSVA